MGLRLVDLNIGTRMLMGFALVLLLLVLALAAGIARLSAFNDSFEQLADHRVPNMAAAQDWQRYLQDSGLKMRNMLILTNPSEIRAQVEIVREDQKKRGELVEGLTRTIVLAGGKEKLADALKAREAYGSLEQKFLELVEAGDIANAKTFLLDSVRPAQLANIDAIGKLVDFEKESVHQSREAAVQAYQSSRNLLLVLGLIAMGVGIAAALLITRGILAQLGGEPAEAARIAGKIAEGELDVRIALKQGDRSSLLFAIEAMRAKLLQIVDDVRQGALQVSEGTIQISKGNDDLSRRTQEQAAAIEETASSMEEMTATVKQNADNANAASGLATNAREQAESGGKVVNDAVAAMAEISSSSRRIADIIVVIDEIAFQTNLLALNAAVEAARAGEQGRGFAVVASEVRNLAQRSAGAAREIKTLIQDSVEKVRTGTELVDASGATLIEIVASVKKVAEIVQEIVSASKQQASGIDQINHAVTQMDSVIQQNAALVEEAAAASKSIEGEAASLQQRVSFFRTGRTHANTHATPAPAPAVRTVKPAPQRIPARPRKVAGGENTWEDF